MGKAGSRWSPARAGESARPSPCISPERASTSRSRRGRCTRARPASTRRPSPKSDTTPLPGSLDVTAELIEKEGRKAFPVVMDLTDRSTLAPGVDAVLSEWGRIDVLVNNGRYIGPGHMDQLLDTPVELLDLHLEANVMAPVILTKLVLPQMLERGDGYIVVTHVERGRVRSARAGREWRLGARLRDVEGRGPPPGRDRRGGARRPRHRRPSTCTPDSSRPNESSSTWRRSGSTAAPARRPT